MHHTVLEKIIFSSIMIDFWGPGLLRNRPQCRGLEPAIFRLRGKGVSARQDGPIHVQVNLYNLGVVLSDSTGATGLPRKFSWRWRLESSVRAYSELDTANPGA